MNSNFLSIIKDSSFKLRFRDDTMVYAQVKACPNYYIPKTMDCGEDFLFYIFKQDPSSHYILHKNDSEVRLSYRDNQLPFVFHLMQKHVWYQVPCKDDPVLENKRYRFQAPIDENNWITLYLVNTNHILNEWKVEKYIYCMNDKMIVKC